MRMKATALLALGGVMAAGCVSPVAYDQVKADLEQARTQVAEEQKRAATEKEVLEAQLAALDEEKTALANRLLATQSNFEKTRAALETAKEERIRQIEGRRDSDREVLQLNHEGEQLIRMSQELRRERDQLRARSEDLQRRLDAAQQEVKHRSEAVAQAEARTASLGEDMAQVEAALAIAQNDARDLEVQLAAARQRIASVNEEKQRLMSGTMTAQEEIAHLQKLAGELGVKAALVEDLEQRLSEREQKIEELRVAEGQVVRLKQEVASHRKEVQRLAQTKGELSKSLEHERALKEAEIKRLTRTQAALNKSLRAEIAKGDIRIQQVRDRLTINMVDRVLFASGHSALKVQGLEILQRVSKVLKKVGDKQIRIEGHTDNVPIGGKLKSRFPTNWELSTARASSVVRYLVEKGGVDRTNLTAVGHADTQPIAGNDTEAGRRANRRIEIVLYPKDLPGLVGGSGS